MIVSMQQINYSTVYIVTPNNRGFTVVLWAALLIIQTLMVILYKFIYYTMQKSLNRLNEEVFC